MARQYTSSVDVAALRQAINRMIYRANDTLASAKRNRIMLFAKEPVYGNWEAQQLQKRQIEEFVTQENLTAEYVKGLEDAAALLDHMTHSESHEEGTCATCKQVIVVTTVE
jgi:hypothetical protein